MSQFRAYRMGEILLRQHPALEHGDGLWRQLTGQFAALVRGLAKPLLAEVHIVAAQAAARVRSLVAMQVHRWRNVQSGDNYPCDCSTFKDQILLQHV